MPALPVTLTATSAAVPFAWPQVWARQRVPSFACGAGAADAPSVGGVSPACPRCPAALVLTRPLSLRLCGTFPLVAAPWACCAAAELRLLLLPPWPCLTQHLHPT